MFYCIIENMNPNYNIIPCFVEKNPKKHLKFVLYQNKVFYYKYLHLPLPFSNLRVSSPPYVFQNFNLLNYPKSHHHDQNNKNSKFKLTKFLD